MPTFAEYALGWWEWDTCAYLKKRRKRYNITQGYADQAKRNLHKVLLPYFGKKGIADYYANRIQEIVYGGLVTGMGT
jgi:hypothetical protein